jgi:hypothetical protein
MHDDAKSLSNFAALFCHTPLPNAPIMQKSKSMMNGYREREGSKKVNVRTKKGYALKDKC